MRLSYEHFGKNIFAFLIPMTSSCQPATLVWLMMIEKAACIGKVGWIPCVCYFQSFCLGCLT